MGVQQSPHAAKGIRERISCADLVSFVASVRHKLSAAGEVKSGGYYDSTCSELMPVIVSSDLHQGNDSCSQRVIELRDESWDALEK